MPIMPDHFFWKALGLAPIRKMLAAELNAEFARFIDGLPSDEERSDANQD